jgi:succinyldiaminopimelate transaminase
LPQYDQVAAPPFPSRGWAARRVSARLPQFPWDRLDPYRERAEAAVRHRADEIADLSVGTPVDPTPEVVQTALRRAADAPGYPKTSGTAALREAAAGWLARRCGATAADPAGVLPTIGSKELVASLPSLLGLGPGDVVVHPELAYPTYDIGARLCGAEPLPSDSLAGLGPRRVALLWLNSPANPTGRVLPTEHMRKVVRWARERGVVVVSDECYIELGWDVTPVSVLHPDVCEGSYDGLLAVHSLSKRSNLAGYRAGFIAGDLGLVRELLEVRKHAGMMVPAPVQAAMVAALSDDAHVEEQRQRYAARRSALLAALAGAGFRVDHSEAGLYVWATRGESCWDTVAWLADRGVVVAPGAFYGPRGARHVRIALTATDVAVARAVQALNDPTGGDPRTAE